MVRLYDLSMLLLGLVIGGIVKIKHTLQHDTKMLGKQEYHEEVREMLERLGVDPDKIIALDTDENIPKLMEAKALVKEITESVSMDKLFEKDENGRFGTEAKVTALSVMTASVGIMENFGVGKDAAPYYTGVSKWLGVSVETLRNWWKHQESIMLEQGALGYAAVQRITLQQITLMEKYTKALDLDDVQIKKMQESPKGVAVILKIVTQLALNVKYLNVQKEVVAGVTDKVKEIDKHHGVSILMPNEVENE